MTVFRDLTETRELVESFTRPAASLLPISRLHAGSAGDAATWAEMAQLGWLAIGLPEATGGVGLTLLEEVLASQALGRQLVPSDFPATVLAAHAFLALGLDERVAELASGAMRASLACRARSGSGLVTLDADAGSYLVVLSADRVEIFTAAKITLDDAVHWGRPVGRTANAAAEWSVDDPTVVLRGQLLIAAILAGIASEAAARGVDYAKVREQFGQPIGAFQAVKHHCANMAIAAHAARELVTFAALASVEGESDSAHLARCALNLALRAARDNAGTNIQVHGGMGFSDECDAHLFLKATRLLDAAVGGIDATRQALAEAA